MSWFEFAYQGLHDSDELDLRSLYVVGHSLGGDISQAVGAQLYYLDKHLDARAAQERGHQALALAAPSWCWQQEVRLRPGEPVHDVDRGVDVVFSILIYLCILICVLQKCSSARN